MMNSNLSSINPVIQGLVAAVFVEKVFKVERPTSLDGSEAVLEPDTVDRLI